jgi:class 3 adenylate cyclase/tetratricopeptide (TPR) repeat protein
MDFYAVLDQVVALLRSRGRVSYRALKRQFALDDEVLADLKAELRYARYPVVEDEDQGLVWTGETGSSTAERSPAPDLGAEHAPHSIQPSAEPRAPEAERRQLTVLFCDLVDSTVLASRLDPEELREVVRAYQTSCAEVIRRFGGHIAQYLGDGLLVYFGYPQAHEDDAQRAVRAGLGIVEAIGQQNRRLEHGQGVRLAVRVGVHTGLVVVGEIGGSERQERLALGDTPNVAARLQALAKPDTVVLSAATYGLVQGYFSCHELGPQVLKGLSSPLQLYQALYESGAQSRLDVAAIRGLTPLVGREPEVTLLQERWAQVEEGRGQVVVVSGEAGIGKSRLVQVLKDDLAAPHAWWECRCSPYHQHSAFYPAIDLMQRVMRFNQEDAPEEKLHKLEGAVEASGLIRAEVVPLLATLLSLPLPEPYEAPTFSPQRQKEQILQAVVAWLLAATERQALLSIWEDLHWADPSTLELVDLLIDQAPTARMFIMLTFRPEFTPPWGSRTHVTALTLDRLPHIQAEELVAKVTDGKALPAEVLQQVVRKTDGVPLFVEELTKMVLESGLLRECGDGYELIGPLPPLAIPTTLHDSLMTRLDRLAVVKEVAQLGATLGRTFSYALLQAVSPWNQGALQRALAQLVDAELLYQRGVPPQATYIFKHALIQDTAYQSLLKSTRQQSHQRIAQVLEAQFPETVETQPELLAHHYTEAGLTAQAVRYWHQAGQRAHQRSANQEAIQHFSKGLEVLATRPETPDRVTQELTLRIALGAPLMATKGYASSEVAHTYARARELCQQLGETPQLFSVLLRLHVFYLVRGEFHNARELGEQCLHIAQHSHDPVHLLEAHYALGSALFWLGDLATARTHFEHSIALYDPQQRHSVANITDTMVTNLSYLSWLLWLLGYPDQALRTSQKALARARQLAHPYSLAFALSFAVRLHHARAEIHHIQQQTEELTSLGSTQGFPYWVAVATIWRGWIAMEQGRQDDGMVQLHQGLTLSSSSGSELLRTFWQALLAEVCAKVGQVGEGLQAVDDAFLAAHMNGERFYEAELCRLKGILALQTRGQHAASDPQADAEACFRQALDRARRQQAKSLELRAAISLARLWQQQGKCAEARRLLGETYGWFIEGFDTADLQAAKALLEEL